MRIKYYNLCRKRGDRGDCAEIESQREKERRLQQAKIEPSRSVCTTCTDMA